MIMRPKLALCLYGRFNNRFSNRAGVEGASYIRKQILQDRDVDVFVFSHDLENEQTIRSLYGAYAREMVFEDLPDFGPLIAKAGIDESLFSPIEGFRTVANTLAFLYARSRSLGLLRARIEKGNDYDVAICCRFDLGQLDRVGRRIPAYAVSEINFNANYDMSQLYSAFWNQLNMGFGDQWFYSDPSTLIQLESMYDRTFDYLRPDSSYLAWLSEGITDSKSGDVFSNEILKPLNERSVSLDTLPVDQAIHNHLLHKYFFIEQGLYEYTAFVSDFEDTAHILYTHSSYADLWPVYFGQERRYLSAFANNYVLVDKYSPEIPAHYKQIIYDHSTPYVDRLLQSLALIPQERIFIDHEDMFLIGRPNLSELRKAWARIKPGVAIDPTRLDFVRLVRGGLDATVSDPTFPNLHHLLPWSRWHFSIQPSFWLKQSFLKLLSAHRGQGIWAFESSSQKSVRRLRLHGAALWSEGAKRGAFAWDNPIYPYIATAVSQGKWTTGEFGDVLPGVFADYGIDPTERGELQSE